jgi:hypothetical protein
MDVDALATEIVRESADIGPINYNAARSGTSSYYAPITLVQTEFEKQRQENTKLQGNVAELQNNVVQLEEEIRNLFLQNSTLNNQLSTASQEQTELQSNLQELQAQLDQAKLQGGDIGQISQNLSDILSTWVPSEGRRIASIRKKLMGSSEEFDFFSIKRNEEFIRLAAGPFTGNDVVIFELVTVYWHDYNTPYQTLIRNLQIGNASSIFQFTVLDELHAKVLVGLAMEIEFALLIVRALNKILVDFQQNPVNTFLSWSFDQFVWFIMYITECQCDSMITILALVGRIMTIYTSRT